MKKIVLKRFAAKVSEGAAAISVVGGTWADIIIGMLKVPKNPQAGASIDELRETLPLLAKFEALEFPEIGPCEMILEDAEYVFLKGRIAVAKFTRIDADLLEMVDTINAAEEIEVEEKANL